MRTRLVGAAVAVLLVALGVAIGAGPLQGDSQRNDREVRKQQVALAQRDAEIKQLTDATALDAAYADSTTTKVVAGRLLNRKVAIITLPGADAGTVDQIAGLVRAAGAEVTAQVGFSAAVLEPSSRGLIEALSGQMVEQNAGVAVPAGATGYQRIGALLARAIGVPSSAGVASAPFDPVAIGILSGLKAAKLVDSADVSVRAGLAVVVLPGNTGAPSVAPLTAILDGFASQIPTVVGGPTSAAADGQALAVLRAESDSPASTVDSLETAVGRVITVLALTARTRNVTGDYGIVGKVDAAVPPDS